MQPHRSGRICRKISKQGGQNKPAIYPPSTLLAADSSTEPETPRASIGLIRIQGDYVAGGPYGISEAPGGSVVGALALGSDDITDVEMDVSAKHLRIYRNNGRWLVRDLGSTNGTYITQEPGKPELDISSGAPTELSPGSRLRLGKHTVFVAVATIPPSRNGPPHQRC